jgi:uncharacterized protein DUF1501
MESEMNQESRCPGPQRISRRRMLQVGSTGLLGLGLPRLLRAAARPVMAPAADACILLFLDGGPSHLDMWDMKPNAPAEIRGEFKPIVTSLTGVQLSEHLPKLAKVMHHCALVRSAHHSVNNAHAAAVYCGLTGHDRGEIGGGTRPTDHPAIGSVVGLMRPPKTPVVPYVSMPFVTAEGAGGPPQPGFFGGLLGRPHDPLFMLRDPNAPNFAMPELSVGPEVSPDRLVARRRLLTHLAERGDDGRAREMSGFQARAFELLTSPVTQKAFDLRREPAAVRDAYGRNIYGQSVLLARRLIEAGTRLACVSWAPDANATWDTHGNNFAKLKKELLPQLDAALGSLLGDLIDRGMLKRTRRRGATTGTSATACSSREAASSRARSSGPAIASGGSRAATRCRPPTWCPPFITVWGSPMIWNCKTASAGRSSWCRGATRSANCWPEPEAAQARGGGGAGVAARCSAALPSSMS